MASRVPAEASGVEALSCLAGRVAAGDPEAEGQLVELFQRRVFLLMVSRTRNAETARDLVQETLMAVLGALRAGKLREPERLPAFVLGTARNVASYHLRARWQGPVVLPITPEHAVVDPVEALEASDRLALVRRLVEAFDPTDRAILNLTLFEGLKPQEIAARLGMSPGAVRTRKTRAVQEVIEKLRVSGGTRAAE
jgi:RNA polymerase sigma factor (sigma-70 family)